MLKRIWNRLFPPTTPHLWQYQTVRGIECRTCTVCGQGEELDLGGGHMGSAWMLEHLGDKAKHIINQGN